MRLTALLVAALSWLAPLPAHAQEAAAIVAENRDQIVKPSRQTIGPVIAALAASGDPLADDILSAWADKRLVIRKSDDALFLAAVGVRKPPRWFVALVRGGLRAHGWLRRGTRLGAYPLRLADTPNRTYPGNRYSIEQLKPVHLQRVEGEAPSGTPGDAEAAVAPAGRCPFA